MSMRLSSRTKVILVFLPLLVLAGYALYVFLIYGDDISSTLKRHKKAAQYERFDFFNQGDERLVAYIKSKHISRSALPAFCNTLIYDNSIKGYVDEYNRKVVAIQGMIVDHLTDRSSPMPRTKCDSRALVLGALMTTFGFETRIVHTMGYDDSNRLMGHTFVEVREERGWTLYDPYFGISYKEKDAWTSVNALRVVLRDINSVVPVSSDGEGWEANTLRLNKGFMDRLYGLAIYDNRMNGEKSVVVVNTARITRMTSGAIPGTLDESLLKYLKLKWFDPVIIYI